MISPFRQRSSDGAAAVLVTAALLAAPAVVPDAAVAQAVPARPAADTASGPVSVDSASALRASLERPPPAPPLDALDVVGLPFRVLALPLELAGEAVGAGLELAEGGGGGPPPSYLRLYRSLARWGLELGVESIGPRSGPAASVELTRFEPFHLRTAWSIRGSRDHRAGLRWSGERGGVEAEAVYHRDAEPHFWGLGPRTSAEDRTSFRHDRVEARVAGRLRLAGPLTAGVSAGFEENEVGPGSDEDSPDFGQVVDRDSLYGAAGTLRFLRIGPRLELDLTRRSGFQDRGLAVGATADFYRGLGSTRADFHRVGGWLEAYLPANRRQSLAVRAEAEASRGTAGRGVPFTHMPTLGDGAGGRGYAEGRFRARDQLALAAEWRWEVWRGRGDGTRIESFVFFEEGSAVADLGRLSGSDLRPSWGGGLRLVERAGLVGRAYVAMGEEDVRLQAELSAGF